LTKAGLKRQTLLVAWHIIKHNASVAAFVSLDNVLQAVYTSACVELKRDIIVKSILTTRYTYKIVAFLLLVSDLNWFSTIIFGLLRKARSSHEYCQKNPNYGSFNWTSMNFNLISSSGGNY
jgi:hypothetical protein